ncbi:acyl carrier protein [Longirhabdus pacifica]|uniref:acyl carrier protein n=1 Tax=Longirhabdus pacifica TaxID=2305227 RepID=UPI001008D1C6|nr:acyl carrier protein [Longirhabdus pacifica]
MLDMNEVKIKLIEITMEVTGEGEMPETDQIEESLQKPLEDWGVDSLSALELAVHLERNFGVRMEEKELANLETLADLVHAVEEKGKG